MPVDSEPVLHHLRDWYAQEGVPFREIEHEPTHTSEDSARVRGEPLHLGGKALLIKSKDQFYLCVVPADQQLDSKCVRAIVGGKFRFATADELTQLTGLVPGSVPPFGNPILPFALLADDILLDNDRIAFNAGSLTCSHILAMTDYRRISGAKWVPLTSRGSTQQP